MTKKSRLVSHRSTISSPAATTRSVASARERERLGGSSRAKSGTAVGRSRAARTLAADAARLCGLEEVEHPLDVLRARRVVQDAEAERGTSVHAGRGDEAEAALLEGGGEPSVVVVGAAPAEADDAERRRRSELERRRSPRCAARKLGEVERRSIAVRKASTPNVRSESQSLKAREIA